MKRLPVASAVSVDALLLVLFAALGRRTHDEGSALGGTLTVAAPFLIGYAIAAVALRLDRGPLAPARGTGIWALGVALGLALRGTAFDRGLAPAFVIVAVVATGVLLVGWRIAVAFATRRREPAGTQAPPA